MLYTSREKSTVNALHKHSSYPCSFRYQIPTTCSHRLYGFVVGAWQQRWAVAVETKRQSAVPQPTSRQHMYGHRINICQKQTRITSIEKLRRQQIYHSKSNCKGVKQSTVKQSFLKNIRYWPDEFAVHPQEQHCEVGICQHILCRHSAVIWRAVLLVQYRQLDSPWPSDLMYHCVLFFPLAVSAWSMQPLHGKMDLMACPD